MNKYTLLLSGCITGAAVIMNPQVHAGTVRIQAGSAAAGSVHNRLGIGIEMDIPVSGIDMQIVYDPQVIVPTEVLNAGMGAGWSGSAAHLKEPGWMNLVLFGMNRAVAGPG
ncbi:hypothetical protein JW948_01595, partial [bacterium]|nr:hypothetical protein [bacterium]